MKPIFVVLEGSEYEKLVGNDTRDKTWFTQIELDFMKFMKTSFESDKKTDRTLKDVFLVGVYDLK